MPSRIYMDWNASAPLRPEARAAMLSAIGEQGNASSVHAEGRQARATIESAREQVAALVGADPRSVVFTSGASEANVMALTPGATDGADPRPCSRVLVSAIEHPSVRAGGRFPASAVETIPVTCDGFVDLTGLRDALDEVASAGDRALVSIMAANNETGIIQPVREAAEIVHAAGGLLHVDAAQAAGRIPSNINELGADLLTLSSHKLGGPQGAGALIRRSQALQLPPLVRGGGQERGWRSGTENVAAIAGFGAAAAGAKAQLGTEAAHVGTLRDLLEEGLRAVDPATEIFGRGASRLPNTTLFALPGISAETALMALDLAGIAVSSGSACSSGKVAPSHVLAAMGVESDLAACGIRVSVGWSTRNTDIETFLEAWRKCVAALGKGRRKHAA